MAMFDDLVEDKPKGMFSDIVGATPEYLESLETQRTLSAGMFADIVETTPEQLEKIGFAEAFIEDPLTKIPFSPMAAAETGALITAGMRLQEDRYDLAAERVMTGAQVARGGFFAEDIL